MSVYKCGHPVFQEAKLSEDPNAEIHIQSWKWTAGPHPDFSSGISPRVYHQYLYAREKLFETFPQLDSQLLESAARCCTSTKGEQAALDKLNDKLDEMARTAASEQFIIEQALENAVDSVRLHTLGLTGGDGLDFRGEQLASGHPWNDYCVYLRELFKQAGGERDMRHHSRGKLTAITFVENPGLQGRFDRCKHNFEKKMGDQIQREYILYHGTSRSSADAIVSQGFDAARVKSTPYGFYLASYPGISMGYGGSGNVILVCKVLLGEVKDEREYFSSHGYRIRAPLEDADTLIRGNSGVVAPPAGPPAAAAGALPGVSAEVPVLEGAVEGTALQAFYFGWSRFKDKRVSNRVFIVQRPEQILPIGMLRFKATGIDGFAESLRAAPPAQAYPGDVSPAVPPPRLITPARLCLSEVDAAATALRMAALERKFMPQETKREIDSKTGHIERLKMDYLSRFVCSRCGLDNTKITSVAFDSFLRFHDKIVGKSDDLDELIEDCAYDEDVDDDEDGDLLYESESEEEEEEAS